MGSPQCGGIGKGSACSPCEYSSFFSAAVMDCADSLAGSMDDSLDGSGDLLEPTSM